jgi:hydrogenase nickel incorporation protein HypA/HybF
MHELSIALELVDIAAAEAERTVATRVIAVHVKIGPLSGLVKEALLFSFDAVTEGTSLEGARLLIEETQVRTWCPTCQREQVLADVSRRRCPTCESPTPHLTGGDELEIVGLEIGTA